MSDDPFEGESHEEVVIGPTDNTYPDISAIKAVTESTPYQRLTAAGRLPIMTASELVEQETEPAELGFEPDNHYLGFQIADESLWPTVTRHQLWKQRFYVVTDKGLVGLVPWPGSRIVWPWEAGWHLDSHKETVTSFLKEPKKETKKR